MLSQSDHLFRERVAGQDFVDVQPDVGNSGPEPSDIHAEHLDNAGRSLPRAEYGEESPATYALYLPLSGLVFSGLGFRKGKLGRKWILAVAIFCCGFTFYGCASKGNFQKLGTPPGTYTVTVTAASGNLQHSAPVTLIVQP